MEFTVGGSMCSADVLYGFCIWDDSYVWGLQATVKQQLHSAGEVMSIRSTGIDGVVQWVGHRELSPGESNWAVTPPATGELPHVGATIGVQDRYLAFTYA